MCVKQPLVHYSSKERGWKSVKQGATILTAHGIVVVVVVVVVALQNMCPLITCREPLSH